MKLIVGLGNPGRKYGGTRHNAGYEVLAEIARRHQLRGVKNRFQGDLLETPLGERIGHSPLSDNLYECQWTKCGGSNVVLPAAVRGCSRRV